MRYATVMVSLALDQPNETRLEAAGQLAERFEAAIIGIAASQFCPPLYFTSGEQAQDLIDRGRAAIEERLAELEAQFRAATKLRGRPVEWRSAIDFPARFERRQPAFGILDEIAPGEESVKFGNRRGPQGLVALNRTLVEA